MDFGGFLNGVVHNIEDVVLDPSKIITKPWDNLTDHFNRNAEKTTDQMGRSIQNITGSKEKGLMGVTKTFGSLWNETINNTNPLFLGVAGVGLLAVLVIAVRV